jgi:hypothetical protein
LLSFEIGRVGQDIHFFSVPSIVITAVILQERFCNVISLLIEAIGLYSFFKVQISVKNCVRKHYILIYRLGPGEALSNLDRFAAYRWFQQIIHSNFKNQFNLSLFAYIFKEDYHYSLSFLSLVDIDEIETALAFSVHPLIVFRVN